MGNNIVGGIVFNKHTFQVNFCVVLPIIYSFFSWSKPVIYMRLLLWVFGRLVFEVFFKKPGIEPATHGLQGE